MQHATTKLGLDGKIKGGVKSMDKMPMPNIKLAAYLQMKKNL